MNRFDAQEAKDTVSETIEVQRVGNEWVFADGTRLPVVSGGSDLPPADAPEAPAADPSLSDAHTPDGGEAPADDFDLDAILESDEPFDLDKARKLRSEAKNLRTRLHETEEKWGPWSEVIDGFEDDDLAAVQTLVRSIREDPETAAAMMRRYLGIDDTPSDPAGDTDPEAGDADKPLTRAELDRYLAEREQNAAREAQVAAIHNEAKSLGYDPTAKPGTPEHKAFADLLYLATNRTQNDLAKAHEALEAERKAYVDRYIAEQAEKAKGGPTPPPAGGAGPSGEKPIESYDDGVRAARERFGLAVSQ